MNVFGQVLVITLVQTDVNLRFGLFNSNYDKVIQYLGWQHHAYYGFEIIIFHDTNIHENHDLHTGIIKKQGLQPCLPSLPCAYSHNYYNFGVSKN